MTGLKLFLVSSIIGGLILPVAAYQIEDGAGVANNLIGATGTRTPELLIMLFAFLIFSGVVYYFIKSLEKKDKLMESSQERYQESVHQLVEHTTDTIKENTLSHVDGRELNGRILQKLDDLDKHRAS
jgi:large-conductance mechanosensitive channel